MGYDLGEAQRVSDHTCGVELTHVAYLTSCRRYLLTNLADLALSSSGQAVVLELASPQPGVLPALRYSESPALLDAFAVGGDSNNHSSGDSGDSSSSSSTTYNSWSVGDVTGTKVWDTLPVLWHALSCGAPSGSNEGNGGSGHSRHSQNAEPRRSQLILGPELVAGKRILELGAGSGLLGIGCSILGASEVFASKQLAFFY